MYACMYECMYVCMYAQRFEIGAKFPGCVHDFLQLFMYMYARMYEVDRSTDEYAYVYAFSHVDTYTYVSYLCLMLKIVHSATTCTVAMYIQSPREITIQNTRTHVFTHQYIPPGRDEYF